MHVEVIAEYSRSGFFQSHPGSPRHSFDRKVWSCAATRGRQFAAPFPKLPQTAPQIGSCSAFSGPPTISSLALLKLAQWCQARCQPKGGSSCADSDVDHRPPAPIADETHPEVATPMGRSARPAARAASSGRRSTSRPHSTGKQRKGGQP